MDSDGLSYLVIGASVITIGSILSGGLVYYLSKSFNIDKNSYDEMNNMKESEFDHDKIDYRFNRDYR
jgi:hypothetical protein